MIWASNKRRTHLENLIHQNKTRTIFFGKSGSKLKGANCTRSTKNGALLLAELSFSEITLCGLWKQYRTWKENTVEMWDHNPIHIMFIGTLTLVTTCLLVVGKVAAVNHHALDFQRNRGDDLCIFFENSNFSLENLSIPS